MARHKEHTDNRLSPKEKKKLRKQKRQMNGRQFQGSEGLRGPVNGNRYPSTTKILRMGKGNQIAVPYSVIEDAAKVIAKQEKGGNKKPTDFEVEKTEKWVTMRVRTLITAFELDGSKPRFGGSMLRLDSMKRNLQRDGDRDKKGIKNLTSWLRQQNMITERGKANDTTLALSNNWQKMTAPWGQVMNAVYTGIHANQ